MRSKSAANTPLWAVVILPALKYGSAYILLIPISPVDPEFQLVEVGLFTN